MVEPRIIHAIVVQSNGVPPRELCHELNSKNPSEKARVGKKAVLALDRKSGCVSQNTCVSWTGREILRFPRRRL